MYHFCDAASIVVSVACISCCSSLDLFDFIDVFGGIWVPDKSSSILVWVVQEIGMLYLLQILN